MLAALCRLLCQFTSLWIELSYPHETFLADCVEPAKLVGLQIYIQWESEAFPASVSFWPLKTAVKPLLQEWVHRCLREEVSKRALKDCIFSQQYFVWFWCNRSAFHPSEKGAKHQYWKPKLLIYGHRANALYILVKKGWAWENIWAVAKVEIFLKISGTAALN